MQCKRSISLLPFALAPPVTPYTETCDWSVALSTLETQLPIHPRASNGFFSFPTPPSSQRRLCNNSSFGCNYPGSAGQDPRYLASVAKGSLAVPQGDNLPHGSQIRQLPTETHTPCVLLHAFLYLCKRLAGLASWVSHLVVMGCTSLSLPALPDEQARK